MQRVKDTQIDDGVDVSTVLSVCTSHPHIHISHTYTHTATHTYARTRTRMSSTRTHTRAHRRSSSRGVTAPAGVDGRRKWFRDCGGFGCRDCEEVWVGSGVCTHLI